MANFEAITASSGLRVAVERKAEIEALLSRYRFSEIEVEVESEGTPPSYSLEIYGYGWLQAFPVRQPGLEDEEDADPVNWDVDATEDFLEQLRPFVPSGEQLVIQCIGHEKCRFPLAAWTAIVTSEGVEYHVLPGD